MVWIAITLIVGTYLVNLLANFKIIQSGKAINHRKWAIIRAVGLIPAMIILKWYSVPLVCFGYWFAFDSGLNLLRGYGIWFTGSEDEDDAETDNFLQRVGLMWHIIIKTGGVLIGGSLYLLKTI